MARRHDEHVGGGQEPLGVGPEAEHARAGGGELVALGAVAGDEHRRAGNAARGPDGEQRVLAGLELAEVEDRDLVVAQAELGAHGGPVHGWRRLDGVVDDLEAPGVQGSSSSRSAWEVQTVTSAASQAACSARADGGAARGESAG